MNIPYPPPLVIRNSTYGTYIPYHNYIVHNVLVRYDFPIYGPPHIPTFVGIDIFNGWSSRFITNDNINGSSRSLCQMAWMSDNFGSSAAQCSIENKRQCLLTTLEGRFGYND